MNLKFLTITMGMLLIFSNLALAVPSQPHWFYGAVNINGSPAPDGTTVTAKINGIDVASTTTLDGKYGYEPMFYIPDTEPSTRPGETIRFFVNDVNTGVTETFCTNCFNDCGTESNGCGPLDLSVTIETETPSGGGAPSGGGLPSGGSTTTTTEETTTTTEEQGCQERWTCSDWGECVEGIQTRTCVDENNCGTNSREPFSSQPCTTVGAEEAAAAGPVGFFLLTPTNLIIGSVIGVIVAAIIILLILRRKPKPVVHVVKV